MFLKRCQRRKSGKKHTYWALVESYRTARGSRQRVVAYLGELRSGEQSGWAQLGRTLSGRRRTRPQRSLFDPPGSDKPGQTELVRVRLKEAGVANRRLGRLLQQHWRAGGAFDVRIEPRKDPQGRSRLTVTWQRNPRWGEWARLSEGCYLLRSNLTETDPRTLWKRYIQLTEAEWAFRITKDELEIRPNWHQKQERVEAHMLVCFLAYVLWKTLAGWMRRAGLGDAPRTLVEEFAKIKSGDVVLPTVAEGNQPARTLRLRCVTEPDAAQKALLSRLGLNLPRRLRPLDALMDDAQM